MVFGSVFRRIASTVINRCKEKKPSCTLSFCSDQSDTGRKPVMNQRLNTVTVSDLKEMLAKIKSLDEEDPVAELIEIFEGFEVAMSQYGTEEPQDHQRLLVLLGLTCEMGRRMKDLEATLDRIGHQIRALSPGCPDMGLMDLVHRVPKYNHHEICE
jgi:hypothetical protein